MARKSFVVWSVLVIGLVMLGREALVLGDEQSPPKAYTADADTAGLWHFDEDADSTAKDSGPNHLDGKITGAKYLGDGMEGCLEFDGIDNAIEVPDHASINFGTEDSFTVEARIKTEKAEESLILDKRPGEAYYILRVGGGPAGRVQFIINDGAAGPTGVVITGKTSVADGKWHHVTGVRDRSSKTLKLYVDGKEDAAAVPDATSADISNDGSLKVGCHYSVPKFGVKGLIDEVRISRKARSPEELRQGADVSPPGAQPSAMKSGELFPLASDKGQVVATPPKARAGGENAFRFVVLADTHIAGGPISFNNSPTWELLSKAIDEIKKLEPGPDFVVVLGDLTMNSLATNEGYVGEHEKFKEIMTKAGIPTYPIIGNHDSRSAFRTVFLGEHPPNNAPEVYYSFSVGGWHFIFLDSGDEALGCSEKQRAWLSHELESHEGTPIMILAHHPMLVIGGSINLPLAKAHRNPDYSTMLNLVSKYPNVKWVFNGHVHYNEVWKYRGINFVSNPPIITYSAFEGRIGYRIVDVEGEKVRMILRYRTYGAETDIENIASVGEEERTDGGPEHYPSYSPYPDN